MDDFEKKLNAERQSVERFVRFKISTKEDADDVLQEVFRKRARQLEIPIEDLIECELTDSRYGLSEKADCTMQNIILRIGIHIMLFYRKENV